MITIKTETERIQESIRFAQAQLDEIDRQLHEYDLSEDINGNTFYCPGDYREEKEQLQSARRQWEIMLRILTAQTPVTILDW